MYFNQCFHGSTEFAIILNKYINTAGKSSCCNQLQWLLVTGKWLTFKTIKLLLHRHRNPFNRVVRVQNFLIIHQIQQYCFGKTISLVFNNQLTHGRMIVHFQLLLIYCVNLL